MSTRTGPGPRSALFTRQGLPVFSTFLIWGTGSGAQTLARPLLAFLLTESVFLVSLMIALLAASRMITGPLTGYLTDHWGRKPLGAVGAATRGTASLLIIFVDDSYVAFLVLELVGAVGIAMWQTTSQVMVADMSSPESRGKAVALRGTSLRLGQILGPILGGFIAAVWGVRVVFLINAASKYVVTLITWRMIKETRPQPRSKSPGDRTAEPGVSILSVVATRAFVVLAITTFTVSLMGQGIFHSLFPIAALEVAGLDAGQIGLLIGIAGAITVAFALPNGFLIDRFGRKPALVPGLVLSGVAAALIAIGNDFNGLLWAAAVFGVAQAMTQVTTQTFAIDLAPDDRRGTFLGVWTVFQSFGGFVGPLAAGIIVEVWGFTAAFMAVAVLFAITAFVMAVFGPETRHRGQQSSAK